MFRGQANLGKIYMAFPLILLFMILVFWRPQDWLMPWLVGIPILDVIMFAALLSLTMEWDKLRNKSLRSMPQVYLLIGLWFATLMSHVANTNFAALVETLPETYKFSFFTIMLFLMLDRPSRLRAAAAVFVSMTCLMAVHALLQESRGYGFAGQIPTRGWRIVDGEYIMMFRSKFFGIFEDPNDLAQIMATAIPFAFALPSRKSWWGFLLACGISWLLIEAIMTTRSNGGQIALLGVLVYMAFLVLPARWLPRLSGALIVLGLMAIPFSGPILGPTARERVLFWGAANQAFKTHLFFGVGHGRGIEYTYWHVAHSAYVNCYLELGFFGYWFWYILLQLGVVSAWRSKAVLAKAKGREIEWLRRFSGLSLAAMTGFALSSYFLSRAFAYPMFFLFAMLGVLPTIARRTTDEDVSPLIDVRRDIYVFGSLGAFLSIIYIYISILLLNKTV